jgi:hypothetical protein
MSKIDLYKGDCLEVMDKLITKALIGTVSGEKLVKIALQMLTNGEL